MESFIEEEIEYYEARLRVVRASSPNVNVQRLRAYLDRLERALIEYRATRKLL